MAKDHDRNRSTASDAHAAAATQSASRLPLFYSARIAGCQNLTEQDRIINEAAETGYFLLESVVIPGANEMILRFRRNPPQS